MSAPRQLAVIFLGTCGEIGARSRQHRRRSSVIVERGDARVMMCTWVTARRSTALSSADVVEP